MKTITSCIFLILMGMLSLKSMAVPVLNSHSSATATIYLDFDGHRVTASLWNGGAPIDCAAPALTDAQITEIFNRVAEDYRPFNVNITTDSLKFLSAPLSQRVRVIVTPTSSWKPNVGGVSYIGSFTWGDDTPAFVFSDRLGPNNAKFIAECCSHESGHTLGLSHQSKYDGSCNLTETYNTGSGSGETGWAPIMGNSYNRNMTGWYDGPTPYGCVNTQDNLSIITSANGFGYRTDDFTDSLNTGSYLLSSSSFNMNGIISTATDRDVFRMEFPVNNSIHIEAIPVSFGSSNSGSNLDIKIMLYDDRNTLIRTYNPLTTLSVSIDTTLKPGTYFIVLQGTGNAYTSNYGSIGSYSITGFRNALPIREVTLNGKLEQQKHHLSWNVISDEPLQSLEVEYATDGRSFVILNNTLLSGKSMTYMPFDINTRYYRIKATSVSGQTVYSNIVSLKGTPKTNQLFSVSTFTTSQISVNANEAYRYRIMDINANVLETGIGAKGFSTIDISKRIAGIYVLQLFGSSGSQSERIIKQ